MKNSIIPIFLLVFFISACSFNETCEICGYISLNGDKCSYCGNDVWNDSMGETPEKYLKTKQLDWFHVPGGEPDFLGPLEAEDLMEDKTYKKDLNWKPSVTKEEVAQGNL